MEVGGDRADAQASDQPVRDRDPLGLGQEARRHRVRRAGDRRVRSNLAGAGRDRAAVAPAVPRLAVHADAPGRLRVANALSHQGKVLLALARQRLGSGRLAGPVVRRHRQLLNGSGVATTAGIRPARPTRSGCQWPGSAATTTSGSGRRPPRARRRAPRAQHRRPGASPARLALTFPPDPARQPQAVRHQIVAAQPEAGSGTRTEVSPVARPRRRAVPWGVSGERISSPVVGGWTAPRPSSVAKPAIG